MIRLGYVTETSENGDKCRIEYIHTDGESPWLWVIQRPSTASAEESGGHSHEMEIKRSDGHTYRVETKNSGEHTHVLKVNDWRPQKGDMVLAAVWDDSGSGFVIGKTGGGRKE